MRRTMPTATAIMPSTHLGTPETYLNPQRAEGFALGFVAIDSAGDQAKLGVLLHGEPGEKREALEDHGDVGIGTGECSAEAQDGALRWSDEACKDSQQSALA